MFWHKHTFWFHGAGQGIERLSHQKLLGLELVSIVADWRNGASTMMLWRNTNSLSGTTTNARSYVMCSKLSPWNLMLSGAISWTSELGWVRHQRHSSLPWPLGIGVRHGEYHASNSEPLNFLQTWIEPDVCNGKPSYQQKNFGQKLGRWQLFIKQDLSPSQLFMQSNQHVLIAIKRGHSAYVHVTKGEIKIDG